jgi:hypothetical protein
MRKTCEACGAENPTTAQFCRQCGRPWAAPWIRAATPAIPALQAWRRLKLRMTRKEVRTLLGEPARVDAAPPAAPDCERWTYEYERGATGDRGVPADRLRGVVSFHVADGCVTSWEEPDWTQTA